MIYHTSKHFCACVHDCMPLLKGPDYWSWACLLYISSFSFFVLHIDFSLFFDRFRFISEIIPINKKIYTFLQFLTTQLSNSFFYLKKNAIAVHKETIHTGNITAHTFTNLSIKSSNIFCLSLWVGFSPWKQVLKMVHHAAALSQQI